MCVYLYHRDVLKKLIPLEVLDQLVYKIFPSKGELIFFLILVTL